jgi:hypothetical protein
MKTTPSLDWLPTPEVVRERIAAVEEELKALRRLLRASTAAAKAEKARRRNEQMAQAEGEQ